MARRESLKRVAIGVWYLPLYYFVLYPIAFAVGIVLGVLDILHGIATDENLENEPRTSSRLWNWASDNVDWVFTGKGDFQWTP